MNETIITRRPLPVSLVGAAVTVVTTVILCGYGAAYARSASPCPVIGRRRQRKRGPSRRERPR
ncbi:MAG TPA: hypothetical protein VGF84_06205 [Micromonosporaceae bacterium]